MAAESESSPVLPEHFIILILILIILILILIVINNNSDDDDHHHHHNNNTCQKEKATRVSSPGLFSLQAIHCSLFDGHLELIPVARQRMAHREMLPKPLQKLLHDPTPLSDKDVQVRNTKSTCVQSMNEDSVGVSSPQPRLMRGV